MTDKVTLQTVNATKEIIVSAGTIGTPIILTNSGIADSDVLSDLGIQPLLHLPSVGQNLTEQPAVAYPWVVNDSNSDLDGVIDSNATLVDALTRQWNDSRTGPFVDPPITAFGWFRLSDTSSIFERFEDPSAGPHTAHATIQLLPEIIAVTKILTLRTHLGGSITLTSSNPFDHPIINLNLLSSDFDLYALREGMRNITRFIETNGHIFDGFIVSSDIASVINVTSATDEELEDYIRNNVGGTLHIVGTASMSPKGASWGVVDPDLRVKGAEGLRVVDASVLVSFLCWFVRTDWQMD
jgi:choline dehydrogenase-like flavoprotein